MAASAVCDDIQWSEWKIKPINLTEILWYVNPSVVGFCDDILKDERKSQVATERKIDYAASAYVAKGCR